MTGTLSIVPTPIGNLGDITVRALHVLAAVDTIACEDTRQTIKLLNHYHIKKPLVSFYAHNQVRRVPQLCAALKAGKNIAVVSDGGTPGISDPGALLIEQAIKEGIPVTALPGACAAITAVVASGLPTDGFVFLGFLRRKPGKMKKELHAAAALEKTIVFYESPHRINKTLCSCREIFAADTPVAIGRELTKKFEEVIRGTLADVVKEASERELKGEIVVVLQPTNDSE